MPNSVNQLYSNWSHYSIYWFLYTIHVSQSLNAEKNYYSNWNVNKNVFSKKPICLHKCQLQVNKQNLFMQIKIHFVNFYSCVTSSYDINIFEGAVTVHNKLIYVNRKVSHLTFESYMYWKNSESFSIISAGTTSSISSLDMLTPGQMEHIRSLMSNMYFSIGSQSGRLPWQTMYLHNINN